LQGAGRVCDEGWGGGGGGGGSKRRWVASFPPSGTRCVRVHHGHTFSRSVFPSSNSPTAAGSSGDTSRGGTGRAAPEASSRRTYLQGQCDIDTHSVHTHARACDIDSLYTHAHNSHSHTHTQPHPCPPRTIATPRSSSRGWRGSSHPKPAQSTQRPSCAHMATTHPQRAQWHWHCRPPRTHINVHVHPHKCPRAPAWSGGWCTSLGPPPPPAAQCAPVA
jgi:hypothetical protein